jgi:hypothetical protein
VPGPGACRLRIVSFPGSILDAIDGLGFRIDPNAVQCTILMFQ